MFENIYTKLDQYVNKVRILILNLRGANIGKNVYSFGKFKVISANKLSIGDNSTINENVFFNCRNYINIGKDCHLSPNVQLHTGKLILNTIKRKHTSAPINIRDNVWISTGTVVSAGITIGKNSVIGANSVVVNDVDSNSFYAGNPAKKIKDIEIENITR